MRTFISIKLVATSLVVLAPILCNFVRAGQVTTPDFSPILGEQGEPDQTDKEYEKGRAPAPPVNPLSKKDIPNGSPRAISGSLSTIQLGNESAAISIGALASNFRMQKRNYLANIGILYASPTSSFGYGIKADGSILLTPTLAVGGNLTGYSNLKETVLNGVWMPADTNFKLKLSSAYRWGQQSFGFYSGPANADLAQQSYFFSGQYDLPKERNALLHSVGITNWGARAKQTNLSDPIYFVAQTPSSYQVLLDYRKLATGILDGASIDTQVGISKEIKSKMSLGYETLVFPLSDGTREARKVNFQSLLVEYQPLPELILQAAFKVGAAENSILLSMVFNQWRFSGYKNIGNNGVVNNQGISFAYNMALDGGKSIPFSSLNRSFALASSANALREASIRPSQLSQNFLAKVDATAVKNAANIVKSALPAGATVNSSGDILLTVGAGGGTITNVIRNGDVHAYSSTIQMAGTQLVIRTKLLAIPIGGGDKYVISILDSTGISYLVTILAQA
jgi:hypothetical protein